jgi:hypothetical protein
MLRVETAVATCLLALCAAGCPADGAGDDLPAGAFTSGPGDESATDGPVATTDSSGGVATGEDSTGFGMVSYAESVQPIWNGRCFGTTCHDIDQPGGALNLATDGPTDPYTELTTRSHALSGMPYVTVGDPNNSYLWRKLEGTHTDDDLMNSGGGSRMPLGTPALDDGTMALIEAWIVGGALP